MLEKCFTAFKTNSHHKDVQNTASKLEETRDKAYNIAENLDTVLVENVYRDQET